MGTRIGLLLLGVGLLTFAGHAAGGAEDKKSEDRKVETRVFELRTYYVRTPRQDESPARPVS